MLESAALSRRRLARLKRGYRAAVRELREQGLDDGAVWAELFGGIHLTVAGFGLESHERVQLTNFLGELARRALKDSDPDPEPEPENPHAD
jgi:hypothetical protein